MRSTALIPAISSSNISTIPGNSSSAAIEVIQGLMDGLGWHNLSSSIHQADAEQELADQKLTTAIKFYLEEQDADSCSRLIRALHETLQAKQSEYDHAVKELQYYQEQAQIEAEKKTEAPSYLSQWSYWAYDVLKSLFGSTTEQQIEKYQQIASNRQKIIEKLSKTIESVREHLENESLFNKSGNNLEVNKYTYAAGQFPSVIELSELDGVYGFKINGDDINDSSGSFVSSAGDINNDGYGDLLVGAAGASPNNIQGAGTCYVIFGAKSIGDRGIINFSFLNGTTGFRLDGISIYTNVGHSGNTARDINWDNYTDFITGTDSLAAYVMFGSEQIVEGGSLNVSSLNGKKGFSIFGDDFYMYDSLSVGNMNNDSYPDLVIGGYDFSNKQQGYVVFGSPEIGKSGQFDLATLNGTNGYKFNITDTGITAGPLSINVAGDVNGDGIDDIIVGAVGASPNNLSHAGTVFVIFGQEKIVNGELFNLTQLDGTNGFTISGESAYASMGSSVNSAGDVNGDGYTDFLISTLYNDMYVVFGNASIGKSGQFTLSSLNGNNGFRIVPEGSCAYPAVSPAGDFNGDGYADFLIGMPESISVNNNGSFWGRTYLLFGGPQFNMATFDLLYLDGSNGIKFYAESLDDYSGDSVSFAGDVNGDGVDDIILSAPSALSSNHTWEGRSYVIFGDIPPTISNNSLTLSRSAKVLINATYLAAIDKNHDNNSLIFIPTNITHGYFEKTNQPGLFLINFTQQQIISQQVQFVHDGSLDAPTYNITVKSSGIAWVGPSAPIINFNPMPIILVNNQVIIDQNQTVILTTANLLAICNNISDPNLIFTITNITHGSFIIEDNIVQGSVVNFTQQKVVSRTVSFAHDGSPYTPAYQVSVSDTLIQTEPTDANITLNAIPIVLVYNQLTLNQTQTVSLTADNLLAARSNIADPDFVFVITNITHGTFSTAKHVQQSQEINFTQQEIFDETVFLSQDGSPYTPEYQVSVNDGWNQTEPVPAQIIFNLIPFALINNQLTIKQNQTWLLTSAELLATRNSYVDPEFEFVITNISHGFFIVNQQRAGSQIMFVQQAVLSGNVTFTHDGSMYAPAYWVAVNDGWNQTNPQAANVTFFSKPVLAINQFLVSLGQSTLLSLNNLCANDCYDDEFDKLQFDVIGDVTSGQFENVSAPGAALTRFTQKNVKQNQIKFVSNGMSTAPRYQLQVTDPVSLLTDSSMGSTLLVTKNYLRINQNQTLILSAENLNVTSGSGLDTEIIYTPVVNTVQHGYFSLISNFGAPIATFKQDQINKNQIAFVSDGSASDPSCIIAVRDSQSSGASGSFPCQVDFATSPRLNIAFLKINPPDSVQINTGNLEASDDRTPPDQLYFIVSEVINDRFSYTTDYYRPIFNFTQAEVSANKVYFVAKTNEPPSFSVTVWNGRLYCQEDCPRVATIVAPDVGGEGSISSLLIGLLSSLGTLVLLPLVKCYFEKAVKSYFSSREDTPDSQVTNEALARLWIGCCGVITHRQHEEYIVAFGHIIDLLNESETEFSLRKEWNHLSDRQKSEIKSAIAKKTQETLVGSQSEICRFFSSFCHSEATPQKIEAQAKKIAEKVKPSISQLFVHSRKSIQQVSLNDSMHTPLMIRSQSDSVSLLDG